MNQKKLRAPVKIHGGKYYLSDFIIDHFPSNYQNMTYLDVFGGAANVLLNKEPSKIEVYNDLCPQLANIFHCMVHNFELLIQKIKNVQYNEETFLKAKDVSFEYGSVDSAIAELILRRMSRGGMKKHFSWSDRLRGGRPGDLNAFETFKELLPILCKRFQNVEVYSTKALDLIKKYDSNDVLIYNDPPYVLKTRTAKKVYDFEMTEEDHIELLENLVNSKAKVLISGYDNELYKRFLKEWNMVFKEMANHSGQNIKKQRRIECLWFNY